MEEKYCIDCKWLENEDFQPLCVHPGAPKDLVTGEHLFCRDMRRSGDFCGPDGIHWEELEIEE